MHQFTGFTDLRLNARLRTSETTLWPSFTDIMTVILMVFMLTMVVVIFKNAHLIDQVRLSQRLQAESEERLRTELAALADLRSLNIDLEDALRVKEMEIILLGDEMDGLEGDLAARVAIIDRLTERQQELLENLRIIRLQMMEKEEEIAVAESRILSLAEESRDQMDELTRQVTDLLSQLVEKEAVLITLSDEKSDLELALARQRRDFSSLEEKYLHLIRPARSAMGKLVATVNYFRMAGERRYGFKDIDSDGLEEVSWAELHQRLAVLGQRHGKDLYVKIVIPDDSGLSYNEAWDFTKDILSRYDYYYIDGWPGQPSPD